MSFFKKFVNHNTRDSFVNRLRKKRFSRIQKEIEALIAKKGKIKILDLGGEIGYWQNIGWQNPNCTIYLLNLDTVPTGDNLPGFYHVTGNALDLPYRHGEFDLVFSNSVIEHMGSTENQQRFAQEVKRLCDNYIIQTPAFWFPLEPHSLLPFFQLIPHSLRARLIMWFNINYFPKAATYREALVVSKSTIMFTRSRFAKLFPGADIEVERLFGIAKSYTAFKISGT
jgi:hypothetical protein